MQKVPSEQDGISLQSIAPFKHKIFTWVSVTRYSNEAVFVKVIFSKEKNTEAKW